MHPVSRCGRQDRDCDEQGNGDADRDGQREVGEHLPLDVLEEHYRYENGDGGRGGGEQGAPYLCRSGVACLGGWFAAFTQAHNVLEYDDRGVEHHARRESEAGQRNDV